MSPLFIKCYLTWPDLREFESAPSLEDEEAPMAAKRHAPSHFDQHVRLPAWGFLLVFYSSHSPKICRFEPRAWDRQRHGRTDGWTGWWMCRQTTVYLRDNGYVSTNIHKLVVHLSSTKLSVCDSASAETKREQSMLSYSPFMALRITFSSSLALNSVIVLPRQNWNDLNYTPSRKKPPHYFFKYFLQHINE